jgi:hypothetical protein
MRDVVGDLRGGIAISACSLFHAINSSTFLTFGCLNEAQNSGNTSLNSWTLYCINDDTQGQKKGKEREGEERGTYKQPDAT